jgi:hypothetical protein
MVAGAGLVIILYAIAAEGRYYIKSYDKRTGPPELCPVSSRSPNNNACPPQPCLQHQPAIRSQTLNSARLIANPYHFAMILLFTFYSQFS